MTPAAASGGIASAVNGSNRRWSFHSGPISGILGLRSPAGWMRQFKEEPGADFGHQRCDPGKQGPDHGSRR